MEELFHKIIVKIPNKPVQRENANFITCYWRWLVCGQIRTEDITTKEKEIEQGKKEEEDKIKIKLTEANQ